MTSKSIRKGPGLSPGKTRGFGTLEPLLGALSLFMVVFAGQPLVSLWQGGGPDHLLQQPSLISHLEYARQEALRRQVAVTVCPSADGRNCQVDADWRGGWLIFTDASEPHRHLSVGDQFLYRQQGLASDQPQLAFDTVSYQADGSIRLN